MTLIRDWYNAIAGNNQLAMLLFLLVGGTAFVVLTAGMLAPFYAAVTIAYVLQVARDGLQRRGLSLRRACALLRVPRSTIGYESRLAKKDAPVLEAMHELAGQYPRYGYPRI